MDTWMGRNHDPITLHKYIYANADPTVYTDPTGNFSIGEFMATVRVRAIGVVQATVRFGSKIKGSPIGRALKSSGAFAIGALLKSEVRRCYRSRGQKCRIPNIVVIGSNMHPESQEHIRDAAVGRGSNGVPIPLLIKYKKGANKNRGWLGRTLECRGKTGGVTGKDCDEFPFATSANGGQSAYKRLQVSLRPISSCDNQCAGRLWGRAVGMGKNGDKYLVVPYGPVSFYYSNGKFGL